jgi:hypothetical protein
MPSRCRAVSALAKPDEMVDGADVLTDSGKLSVADVVPNFVIWSSAI